MCSFIAVPELEPDFHARHRHAIEMTNAFTWLLASRYPAMGQAFAGCMSLPLDSSAQNIGEAFVASNLSREQLQWLDRQMDEILRVLVPVVQSPDLPAWLVPYRNAIAGAVESTRGPSASGA